MDERRNFQRIPFVTKAEIICQGKKYCGELLDISLQGALVVDKSSIPLTADKRCKLAIHLTDSKIILQFDAEMVHRQRNRIGFRFLSEDPETAAHLRRLLELNIGSSEAIEREVALLLKEKHLH